MKASSSKDWNLYSFDDIAIEIKDRVAIPKESGFDRYVGLTHLDSDSLKISRWGSTDEVEKQKMLFKSGDIIFGRRNAYLRRVAVADFDGVCSAHAMVLRAKPETVLPNYLPFFMQTEIFWQAALRNSAGSLSPTINWSNIKKEKFFIPPLDEQKRISLVFKSFQKLDEQIKKSLEALNILECSLTADLLKDSAYKRTKIKDIAKFTSGKRITSSKLPKEPDSIHLIPVMGGNGIAAYCSQKLSDVPNPAVIVGRVGEYCGNVHYIEKPCWISDHALFARYLDECIHPRYFAACLRGLNLNSFSVGGAQPLLNQKIIGELEISIPKSERQNEIINNLEEIETSRRMIEKRLDNANQLRRKSLQKLIEEFQ